MSIQQTRQGFVFQDYIAVEVFLRKYLDEEVDLREYYIDFLYNETAELSHDIQYLVEESGSVVQQCIEVKTGNRFHMENELIGKGLCEIYNYLSANTLATYKIYISKDFESNIARCWSALKLLQEGLPLSRISALQRERMNYLKSLPHLNTLRISDKQLKDFLSRLAIINPSPGVEYSETHALGLEMVISGLIHEVGTRILSIRLDVPRNVLAPPYQLTHELVYITSVYAGTNTDVLPLYRSAIARYFGYASESSQHDVPEIEHRAEKFERVLKVYEGLIEVPGQDSINESTEIGVVS